MMRRVVAAALQNKETKQVICGVRHYDEHMYRWIVATDNDEWKRAEQGFVDNFGTFLTREEAWPIAEAAGQIVIDKHTRVGALHSEDVW